MTEQTKQENVKTNVHQPYSGIVKRKAVVKKKDKVGAKPEIKKAADIDLGGPC